MKTLVEVDNELNETRKKIDQIQRKIQVFKDEENMVELLEIEKNKLSNKYSELKEQKYRLVEEMR